MIRAQASDEGRPGAARPPAWPWWLALVLCLAGLAMSVVLEQIHFKIHTDPAFRSFCAIDRKVNCDIVERSSYAVFLGVPWASWGIFAYLLAAVLSLWGLASRQRRAVAGYGVYLGLVFVATSAVLGAISAFLVNAVCLLCLGTYAVNLLYLGCMLIAARPVRTALAEPFRALRARPSRSTLVIALLAVATVGLLKLHPSYWDEHALKSRTRPESPTLPTGIEPGGGHFIGAEKPALILIEFSDYECPYCRHAHMQLRALLNRYPNHLRLVHRQYPLDQSCNSSLTAPMHENACLAAAVAECAGRQGRFWQANDYLFAEARMLHSRANAEIARDLGLDLPLLEACLREMGPRAVAFDVDEGNRLGIQGTPTFLIEGKTYMGQLPPWVLDRLQAAAAGRDSGASP